MANRWEDLYRFLKSKNYEVYAPSQKTGDCTKRYIVVKNGDGNSLNGTQSTVDYYDIYLYVPLNNYSQLGKFKVEVKNALKELAPEIKDLHQDTQSMVDDSVKAHMLRMTYTNYAFAPKA